MKILKQPITDFIDREIEKCEVNHQQISSYIEDTLEKIIMEKLPDIKIETPIRGSRNSTIQREFNDIYYNRTRELAYRYRQPTYTTNISDIQNKIKEVIKKIDELA